MAILRSAGKHFDEIVVQSVVDLALKMPCELRMIEVAGVDRKHVGMNGHWRVLEVDEHFDPTVIFARRKSEQRMLVKFEVLLHGSELAGARHASILLRPTGEMPVLATILAR